MNPNIDLKLGILKQDELQGYYPGESFWTYSLLDFLIFENGIPIGSKKKPKAPTAVEKKEFLASTQLFVLRFYFVNNSQNVEDMVFQNGPYYPHVRSLHVFNSVGDEVKRESLLCKRPSGKK